VIEDGPDDQRGDRNLDQRRDEARQHPGPFAGPPGA
jgi:hypothetical protein